MKHLLFLVITINLLCLKAYSQAPSPPGYYRELSNKVRQYVEFNVPIPSLKFDFSYKLEFGTPIYFEPKISDVSISSAPTINNAFYRSFWDRIFATDNSYIDIGGERLPLTCIFIHGQDNRYNGKKLPILPDIILRVYLVANDYSCQGPIRPGWPESGGRREAWDTYVYYEIRDLTIMLPVDAKIRFRWAEFPAILIDKGEKQ
jgi:hypothetical protein